MLRKHADEPAHWGIPPTKHCSSVTSKIISSVLIDYDNVSFKVLLHTDFRPFASILLLKEDPKRLSVMGPVVYPIEVERNLVPLLGFNAIHQPKGRSANRKSRNVMSDFACAKGSRIRSSTSCFLSSSSQFFTV